MPCRCRAPPGSPRRNSGKRVRGGETAKIAVGKDLVSDEHALGRPTPTGLHLVGEVRRSGTLSTNLAPSPQASSSSKVSVFLTSAWAAMTTVCLAAPRPRRCRPRGSRRWPRPRSRVRRRGRTGPDRVALVGLGDVSINGGDIRILGRQHGDGRDVQMGLQQAPRVGRLVGYGQGGLVVADVDVAGFDVLLGDQVGRLVGAMLRHCVAQPERRQQGQGEQSAQGRTRIVISVVTVASSCSGPMAEHRRLRRLPRAQRLFFLGIPRFVPPNHEVGGLASSGAIASIAARTAVRLRILLPDRPYPVSHRRRCLATFALTVVESGPSK